MLSAADVYPGQKSLRILCVDDDTGDAELLRRRLNEIPDYQIAFTATPRAEQATELVSHGECDVVFVDYRLGGTTGLDFVEHLRSAGNLAPVIFMTGQGDETIASHAIRAGADDYVSKAELSAERLRQALQNGQSQQRRRILENENRRLLGELRQKNDLLNGQNRRLAELYDTAHQFVDNVSHEFRTPLTVIKEFTAIIADGLAGPVSGQQTEYLRTVLDRVDDLAAMIDDMLDISKLEAGLLGIARKPCSLHDVIARVRVTLERKGASAGVKVDYEMEEGLPTVYCDPEKIGRVVLNLAVNAIKFSGEGKRVCVAGRSDLARSQVCVEVTDQGPGIARENLDMIFERFQQAGAAVRSGPKGFGLGLNIAQQLVQLNLGDIGVRSDVGRGSTFSFTIPAYAPAALVDRFLERVHQFREGLTQVSLVQVEPEQALEADAQAEVEYVIQHQIRRSDLVLPRRSGWLLLAPSNHADLKSFLARVERSLQESAARRRGGAAPRIVVRLLGSWSLTNDRAAFRQRVLESLAPEEGGA